MGISGIDFSITDATKIEPLAVKPEEKHHIKVRLSPR